MAPRARSEARGRDAIAKGLIAIGAGDEDGARAATRASPQGTRRTIR